MPTSYRVGKSLDLKEKEHARKDLTYNELTAIRVCEDQSRRLHIPYLQARQGQNGEGITQIRVLG